MALGTRTRNGQFAPGNPGGPGRPRRETERAYLAALTDAVPLDDWRAVVARAVADAKAGDARAREWLGRYLVGDALKDSPSAESGRPPTLEQHRATLLNIIDSLQARARSTAEANGLSGGACEAAEHGQV